LFQSIISLSYCTYELLWLGLLQDALALFRLAWLGMELNNSMD
jgi:hypothetical protein